MIRRKESLPETIKAAGITLTGDENNNLKISDEDFKRLKRIFREANADSE